MATPTQDNSSSQVHPYVQETLEKAHLNQHLSVLEVASGDYSSRLVLDRHNAQQIVSFLQATPRVKGLSMVSNVSRDDGAMEIMTKAFDDSSSSSASPSQIAVLCLWGGCDEEDKQNGELTSLAMPDEDDGSTLECLAMALKKNTSVTSVRFHYYEFQRPTGCMTTSSGSSWHLRNLLLCKRNLQRITFSACDFGPGGLYYLLEGLAAQTELRELHIDAEDCHTKFQDQQLAAVIQTLALSATKLRLLSLYDCGLGPKSLHALTQLLKNNKMCQLEGLMLGDPASGALLRKHASLRHEFLTALCRRNCSLLRVQVGSPRELELQQILRLCARRNYLVAQVRYTLEHSLPARRQEEEEEQQQQQSMEEEVQDKKDEDGPLLGLLGLAMGALANTELGFVGQTPLFMALSHLAPKIAERVSPQHQQQLLSQHR